MVYVTIDNALRSGNNFQADDIRVIADYCEVCEDIADVTPTGHLAAHIAKIDGKHQACPGGGLISLRVIRIFRADNEEQ